MSRCVLTTGNTCLSALSLNSHSDLFFSYVGLHTDFVLGSWLVKDCVMSS